MEMRVLLNDLSHLEVSYVGLEENPSAYLFAVNVAGELNRGRYDLVHSQGFTSGLCTALTAKVRRTAHLMTSHDVLNRNQFCGIKGVLKRKMMGAFFGMIDIIHSVSYDAQSNLLSYFPSLSRRGNRCVVIHNGIEVERFEGASARDLRRELGVSEDVFLIGFLGRFMAQKGFRYLVDAVELLRSSTSLPKKVLVLTFGEGAFIREENQAIEERGLTDYFRFMPFAPDVAGTIKGLDVIAMPSLWEACPLQPMEALVCGTPFIGSDCVGLREVLRSTPARIVPSADSKALAKAIIEEMLYPSKHEALAFRKLAAARFNVKQRAEEIEKLMVKHVRRNEGKPV
jgi:glycosyltransferase involved in cell wall biosynthesis